MAGAVREQIYRTKDGPFCGRDILRTYFIADLHLDSAQPQTYELALKFFNQVTGADALYILGDLFEYWIGDDAGIQMHSDIVQSLTALSQRGCPVTLMHGNRDFLLGEKFASATQATLVRDDELLITLDDQPALLMHGDTLCIDDKPYQTFRKQVRDRHWQNAFLAKSIDERIAYATHLREQSRQLSADKTQELMDVDERQVQSRFAATGCNTLIHGHTHRPNVHADTSSGCTRWVVGDWHSSGAKYVVHDASGYQLNHFDGILP